MNRQVHTKNLLCIPEIAQSQVFLSYWFTAEPADGTDKLSHLSGKERQFVKQSVFAPGKQRPFEKG